MVNRIFCAAVVLLNVALSNLAYAEESNATERPATLWVATSTNFGYDTSLTSFPTLATCKAELALRQSVLTSNTQAWCSDK